MARWPDPPDLAGVAFRRRLSGDGARTEVWDARFTTGALDGCRAAVKLVREPAAADRDRLAREVTILERLAGFGVVGLLDSRTDHDADTPWLATELVSGSTLRQRGAVRSDDAYLDLAVRAVSCVADVHAQGVAHRDLTDSNVVVSRRGDRVVLIDFGLATSDDPEAGEAVRGEAVADLSGTAGWMAPGRLEPVADHAAAEADDVFSLALVLLAARLGRHPLHADPETAQARIDESQDWPEDASQALPDGVWQVLYPALDFDRSRRPSARELLSALQGLAAHRRARRPDWWRARRTRFVAAGLTAVLLAAVAVVVVDRVRDPHCAAIDGAGTAGDGTVRLGTVLPESGPIARRQQIVAAQLAADDVRAAGSVPGLQVDELTPSQMFNEGDGTDLCGAIDRLVRSGTDVIIGPATSDDDGNVLDAVTGAGRSLISPSGSAPDLIDRPDAGRFFRTVGSDTLQAAALSRIVTVSGQHRRIAVLYRGDAYGDGFAPALTKNLTDEGAAVVLSESYDAAADPDGYAAALAADARTARADAVVLIGFDETATVAKALLDAGVPADALFGTEANMREKLVTLAAPGVRGALAGMRGTTLLPPPSPEYDRFVAALQKRYGGPLPEVIYAAETYDAVIVAALAAAQAGTDQEDRLAANIVGVTRDGTKCTRYQDCLNLIKSGVDIDYDGVSGPLDLTDTGEPCRVSYATVQFGQDGRLHMIGRTAATDGCVGPG